MRSPNRSRVCVVALIASLAPLGCGEAHTPPAADAVPDAQVTQRDASVPGDAAQGDAATPYQLWQRVGAMCDRSAVPQGLHLRESPLCALTSRSLCESPIECRGDEDCREREHARCAASLDGVCTYPTAPWSKRYNRCTQDADCTELANGHCEQMIIATYCEYDECAQDSECVTDERCVCQGYSHACMKVECQTDAECPAGERCVIRSPCEDMISGYSCSTPEDECRTDGDCTDPKQPTCDLRYGHFRCVAACIVDVIALWR